MHVHFVARNLKFAINRNCVVMKSDFVNIFEISQKSDLEAEEGNRKP
jgi:hypothetical protein